MFHSHTKNGNHYGPVHNLRILNSKWEDTILDQTADDTHKLLYDFHFFMHAIFIHVAPKYLNFTTVSKDFITYIFSVILSCIPLKRHTKNPLFLEIQGQQVKKS